MKARTVHLGRAMAGAIVVVAACLCLVASGDVSLVSAQPAQAAIQQRVLVDQQVLEMELEPGVGTPEVNDRQATTLAASYLVGSDHTTSIQSRYVLLTFRDSEDKVTGGVQSRPAWLVTFRGVNYQPSGSSASVCSCAASYQRPNTVVTLDARTGALIALLGAEN